MTTMRTHGEPIPQFFQRIRGFRVTFTMLAARRHRSQSTAMLKTGLLNPAVLSLLARVRHTNTLVIADRGFPFWPQVETIDLSLVDDVPTVLQVLTAIRANFG